MSERAVGLADDRDRPVGARSAALDRLTQLAGQALDVPVVCVSLVDADRRLLTSSYGLSAPTALLITWSFMKQVVASGRPLVVTDGRRHPLVAANPAVKDGTVAAYVGMPLVAPHGRTVGALSVLDPRPRRWSTPQLDLLRKLSARIVGVTELGAAARGLRRVVKRSQDGWRTAKGCTADDRRPASELALGGRRSSASSGTPSSP